LVIINSHNHSVAFYLLSLRADLSAWQSISGLLHCVRKDGSKIHEVFFAKAKNISNKQAIAC